MQDDFVSFQTVVAMIVRWVSLSHMFRVLLACLALTACKADDPPVRGQLMIILQTDMSLPKDVTQVKILVEVGGKPYHDKNYIIAPGENWVTKLPATLAVVASVEDPTPRVEVSVIGLRGTDARVFAQAVTTIPESRIATLYVPIQWLCDGSAQVLPKDKGYVSTCEPKNGKAQACRAGTCEDVAVDEKDLKDYDPSDVFGGSDDPSLGLCFDTVKCFEAGFSVVPNQDCVVEVGVPDGYELNLALLNPANNDGICNKSGDACYIPLDKNDLFGWSYAKGTKATSVPIHAQLPVAVCEKLDAGEIAQVQATLACATKTLQFPTCGPWSSVDTKIEVEQSTPPEPTASADGGGGSDGGLDSGLGETTQLLIELANPDDVIEIGLPVNLQLFALDSEGQQTDVTDQADWSSKDEHIATVAQGVVTGHAVGSTQVSAKIAGLTAHFDVNVERGTPTSVVVDGVAPDVAAGLTLVLSAQANYPDDNSEDATDVVTWSSSDESIATVDSHGVVTGKAEGTVTITAELNGTTSNSFEVLVTPAVLVSIAIVPEQVGVNEYQLHAQGTYSDNTKVDITDQVTWEQTSGEEFGTVDSTGHMTVIAVGKVGVKVTSGNVTKQVSINVTTSATPDAGP